MIIYSNYYVVWSNQTRKGREDICFGVSFKGWSFVIPFQPWIAHVICPRRCADISDCPVGLPPSSLRLRVSADGGRSSVDAAQLPKCPRSPGKNAGIPPGRIRCGRLQWPPTSPGHKSVSRNDRRPVETHARRPARRVPTRGPATVLWPTKTLRRPDERERPSVQGNVWQRLLLLVDRLLQLLLQPRLLGARRMLRCRLEFRLLPEAVAARLELQFIRGLPGMPQPWLTSRCSPFASGRVNSEIQIDYFSSSEIAFSWMPDFPKAVYSFPRTVVATFFYLRWVELDLLLLLFLYYPINTKSRVLPVCRVLSRLANN